ncbi:T9SS type A sorting domain-containing protein [Flammeovirga aprica]|uniref:T9SS type A sorting domain-containing protein n=1 Tax=Flammeovirga aprica JL-4 TaxID=694437 RepID=A0A7X9NZV1_9BACT|nr:T9SS type A sorting domain-containing protein [Flammeovirga aprica]NME66969.1 T9SS type A sorting domain-containing protein [Flammeovirga aprica JL-4]
MKGLYLLFLSFLLINTIVSAQCTIDTTPTDDVNYNQSDVCLEGNGTSIEVATDRDITITYSDGGNDPNDGVDYYIDVTWNIGITILRNLILTSTTTTTGPDGNDYAAHGIKLVIAPNTHVEIQGNLELDYGSSIEVQDGGKLTITGDLTYVSASNANCDECYDWNILVVSDEEREARDTYHNNIIESVVIIGEENITVGGTNDLPVELTYFQASSNEEAVNLEWETASEINASHFDIQRSADRKTWETLGAVEASGNSQVAITYEFEDTEPLPLAYYRLKQVDFDGVYEFFGPLQVALNGKDVPMELLLMPNNINSGQEVQFNLSGLDVGNNIEITIYNGQGNIVFKEIEEDVSSEVYLKPLDFTSTLGTGMYYVVVKSGKDMVKEKLLIR